MDRERCFTAMAKVHNLAFDYSAYDNAQEAEAQRAIKYKKNPITPKLYKNAGTSISKIIS